MDTVVRFAHIQFAECVDFCLALDKKCFPQQMWLDEDEIRSLHEAGAWATAVTYNGQEIGLTITIPELNAHVMLDGIDRRFTPSEHGAYSYSEAIDPDFQCRGIGKLLLTESQIFTAKQGFSSLSAHVRRKNGWDKARHDILEVSNNWSVPDFWPAALAEPVMYQRAAI
jgi:ribosomal protein S18 acetylase RimI-like enzyme